MVLAQWFVPGVFVVICIAVIVGAKQIWLKGFGVLFGLLFLQAFLSAFTRDTIALIVTLVIAILLLVWFVRKKRKKKRDDDDDHRGGPTVNIYN